MGKKTQKNPKNPKKPTGLVFFPTLLPPPPLFGLALGAPPPPLLVLKYEKKFNRCSPVQVDFYGID
jgi:hypothetical protein